MHNLSNSKSSNTFADNFNPNDTINIENAFISASKNTEMSSSISTPSMMSGTISPCDSNHINSSLYGSAIELRISHESSRTEDALTESLNLPTSNDKQILMYRNNLNNSYERINDHRNQSPFSLRNCRAGFHLSSSRAENLYREILTFHNSTNSLAAPDIMTQCDNKNKPDKYDALRELQPNTIELDDDIFSMNTGWSPSLLSTGPYGWSQNILSNK